MDVVSVLGEVSTLCCAVSLALLDGEKMLLSSAKPVIKVGMQVMDCWMVLSLSALVSACWNWEIAIVKFSAIDEPGVGTRRGCHDRVSVILCDCVEVTKTL